MLFASAGLGIRSFVVNVRCFCFGLSQLSPCVIHAMGKGPIRANRKHPQNRGHAIGKEIRRPWMSTERPDNKEYNPFRAAQKTNITLGYKALCPSAGVAYHNRAH